MQTRVVWAVAATALVLAAVLIMMNMGGRQALVSNETPAEAAAAMEWRMEMLRLINAERKKAGVGPLCLNAKLNASAQAHTADQARRRDMSHTGGDGSSVGQRTSRSGYRWTSVGENVAAGYRTIAQVMNGWMTSPGHRSNLLSRGYKHVGLGRVAAGGSPYWTQVFGSGSRETCVPPPAPPTPGPTIGTPPRPAGPPRPLAPVAK